ncbi:MAG: SPFH domain-containing protein [Candidatus ainarchaeum sp.]|nr:SPFH domain-containing protein [Candidatus ainarchaeum sp.]
MVDVIKWDQRNEDEIVFTYPGTEFEWGSQLVVDESQEAVFYRDGKAYDVLGPGRHTLTTQNLPLLTAALKLVYGKSPFQAKAVFVSTRKVQGRFGTSQPVMVRISNDAQVPKFVQVGVRAFGEFWFRIAEPKLFVVGVVGTKPDYGAAEVRNYLNGFFLEKFIDTLAGHPFDEIYTKLDETSAEVKTQISAELARFGVELIDLKVSGASLRPEDEATWKDWQERLFYLKSGARSEMILTKDMMVESSRELSKSGGAAFGAGLAVLPTMGAGMAQQAGQQPQAPQQPAGEKRACVKCGALIPADSRFCKECGAKAGGKKK